MADRGATAPAATGSVAYLLKGYPRMSEIFIASEIERLERAGLSVRLYVIKQPDERARHPVVERIRARPSYLPAVDSVSGTSLARSSGCLITYSRTDRPARSRRSISLAMKISDIRG